MTSSIFALGRGQARRAGLGLWLVASLVAACVDDRPLEPGQGCPCAPGWSCDPSRLVCVPADGGGVVADADVMADGPQMAADAGAAEVAGGETNQPVPAVDAPPDVVTCNQVSYPETGFFGPNLLGAAATSFVSDERSPSRYQLAADLVSGATVAVKFTMSAETLSRFRVTEPDSPVWAIHIGVGAGWLISTFDAVKGEQVFQSQAGTIRPELPIVFRGSGEARIDYFECGSAAPTRMKMITWAPAADGGAGD